MLALINTSAQTELWVLVLWAFDQLLHWAGEGCHNNPWTLLLCLCCGSAQTEKKIQFSVANTIAATHNIHWWIMTFFVQWRYSGYEIESGHQVHANVVCGAHVKARWLETDGEMIQPSKRILTFGSTIFKHIISVSECRGANLDVQRQTKKSAAHPLGFALATAAAYANISNGRMWTIWAIYILIWPECESLA